MVLWLTTRWLDLQNLRERSAARSRKQQGYLLERGEPLKKGRQAGASREPGKEPGDDAPKTTGQIVQRHDSGTDCRRSEKNGGLITKEDLAAYKAVERTPISGDYPRYTGFSMPPPSSGGIHMVQILNILGKLG
ncbi:gamma-glutamyltransferase [Escherichia coli]